MNIAPHNAWNPMRTWFEKALGITGSDQRTERITMQLVVGRKEESLPSLGRVNGGPAWATIGGEQVGATVDELVAWVVNVLAQQCGGWHPEPTVRVRFFSKTKKGQSNLPAGSDTFRVEGDFAANDRDDSERFSALELAKRQGITSNEPVASTQMNQFLLLALMEQTDRTVAALERVTNRALDAADRAQARLEERDERLINLEIAGVNARGEADAEKRRRALEEEDNGLKRSLISMLGTNLSRAIDLGMVAWTGQLPNDPDAKQELVQRFLSQSPDVVADIGLGSDESLEKLLPAIQKFARDNPGRAEKLGERLFDALSAGATDALAKADALKGGKK